MYISTISELYFQTCARYIHIASGYYLMQKSLIIQCSDLICQFHGKFSNLQNTIFRRKILFMILQLFTLKLINYLIDKLRASFPSNNTCIKVCNFWDKEMLFLWIISNCVSILKSQRSFMKFSGKCWKSIWGGSKACWQWWHSVYRSYTIF